MRLTALTGKTGMLGRTVMYRGLGGWAREVGGSMQRTWEGSNTDGWQVNALERNRLENTNIYCEEGRLEINKT